MWPPGARQLKIGSNQESRQRRTGWQQKADVWQREDLAEPGQIRGGEAPQPEEGRGQEGGNYVGDC